MTLKNKWHFVLFSQVHYEVREFFRVMTDKFHKFITKLENLGHLITCDPKVNRCPVFTSYEIINLRVVGLNH